MYIDVSLHYNWIYTILSSIIQKKKISLCKKKWKRYLSNIEMERVYSLPKVAFPAAATREETKMEKEEPVAFLLSSICLQSSSTQQEQPSQHLPAVGAYGCQGASG